MQTHLYSQILSIEILHKKYLTSIMEVVAIKKVTEGSTKSGALVGGLVGSYRSGK